MSFLRAVVTSRTCLRARVLEKNTRVVLRKLKRWIRIGIARADSAHKNEGYRKLICDSKLTLSSKHVTPGISILMDGPVIFF